MDGWDGWDGWMDDDDSTCLLVIAFSLSPPFPPGLTFLPLRHD